MKKKLFILCLLIPIFITGCFNSDNKDVFSEVEKKYKNLKSYHLTGVLEIVNNDDTFKYDVDVLYKKDDKYKVSLTNKNNNHEQIILKNNDGVYVLTPSLNKSFKFQSNWPYNNSQVYLIKSIVDDLKNDKERTFIKNEKEYIYTTKVNYPNNRRLVNQKVTLDENLKFKMIEVKDENDITYMKMIFDTIDLSPVIDDNTFKIENIIKIKKDENKPEDSNTNIENSESQTSSIEDIIYPLYIPTGTKLTHQETIKKADGERILMTFDGEKSFMLIEETASVSDEFEIIPTLGEPCILMDTIAALTETSISWNSGNVDYYLVSDVMSQDELLDVARSISSIPTMK